MKKELNETLMNVIYFIDYCPGVKWVNVYKCIFNFQTQVPMDQINFFN